MTDYIPTTQTIVAKLRQIAKQQSRETSLPLHQCLESAAQESGYQHWKQLLQCRVRTRVDSAASTAINLDEPSSLSEAVSPGLALLGYGQERLNIAKASFARLRAQGISQAIKNPLKGDFFVDVTIEGHRFQAGISDTPYIALKSKNGHGYGGDCALGVSSIANVTKEIWTEGEKHWAVCKYETQFRIDLSDLSDAGRRTLAIEFGLPILISGFPFQNEGVLFYGSTAYDALVAWAKLHPRKIKQYGANSYLGRWSLAATLDAGIKPNKTDLLE